MTDAEENEPTRVCRNPGCSGTHRDEFDGCCSMVCSLENAAIGASIRDPRPDVKRAVQDGDSGREA